jgi:protoporphyrinogen/coproporphyrinogen III oxidase
VTAGTEPFVVVGGGVAGLVVARDLARAGREVTVLEASDRLGGQLDRVRLAPAAPAGTGDDGVVVDGGAEAFATRGGTVAALARELGLGEEIVSPEALGSWTIGADGVARPLPAAGLLGIPGTPLAADVIAAIGTGAALKAYLRDALLPMPVAASSRTLGELVRRRMGSAVLDALVAPVARGVHSAHPDALELDRVAPGLRDALRSEGTLASAVRSLRAASPAGSQVQGIRGGVVRLVDALVADLERHGAVLRTGARASEPDLFGVTVDGERVPGRVVIAAPGVAPTAPAPTPAHLVLLLVDAPALDARPRGTGVLVADGAPGVTARALTHVSAKWRWVAEAAGGRHVIRLSYGAPVDDDTARRDAATLLGVPLAPPDVVATAHRTWSRAARVDAVDGPVEVGEAVAGTGLAAVVRRAREQAESSLQA